MKGKVEIRPICVDDLRNLFMTGKERCGYLSGACAISWNEKNLAEIIADNPELSVAAFYKKTITGFIIGALENGGTAAVKWLWAEKPADNDIAGRLLHAFQQCLKEKNINKIRVSVTESSSELIELFLKFGFTETEHVLIMENFLPKN